MAPFLKPKTKSLPFLENLRQFILDYSQ